MTHPPAPNEPGRPWQHTRSGDLPLPNAARPQPPLREVLEGLDVRELEGETVFDQFFGLPPHGGR